MGTKFRNDLGKSRKIWHERTYDANGNLATQVAPGVTTTYTYDNLDRATLKDYSDSTPDVTYVYGITGYGTGCLTSVANSVSTTSYTYGPGCAVKTSTQTTGTAYAFEYGYNLAGALTHEKYPSGKLVETKYDSGGRPTDVCNGVCSANDKYAGIGYHPQYGLPTSMLFGNGVAETRSYNNRLQVTGIAACGWSMVNCYASGQSSCAGVTGMIPGNNGNVQGQVINSAARSYGYDALNRLTSTTQGEGYSYDRYGNRARTGHVTGHIVIVTFL